GRNFSPEFLVMMHTVFSIPTTDSDQAARGVLLKGAALLAALGGALFLAYSLVSATASGQYLTALSVLSAVSLATFAMAHLGYVRSGGVTLAVAQLLFLTFFGSSAEDLLTGPNGAVYILPVMITGMVVGARAVLPVAALASLLVVSVPLLRGAAWDARAAVTPFVLLLAGGLLWLIISLMERSLRTSRQQTLAAEADRAALAARESSLQSANAGLLAANDQLEALVSLVRQLETPVIPLLDGVLVAPLVGNLDSRRIDEVAAAVLGQVHQQRAQTVIIDITGIPVMDTQSVQALNQLAQAVRLLGAEVILTGINAEVAQTVSQLGLRLPNIHTAGRLQDGVAAVLARAAARRPEALS
ncbi:MAG TPA: STAS domain-containing protein, partial [Herpetosiphonaceae bacterium]